MTVEAYNIDGTNYFMLRDLAALLRGTPAQFDVNYDALHNAVVMTTGAAYSGEAAAQFTDRSASTVPSPQTVDLDRKDVSFTAYNIGGNNFFGLRELAAYLGYSVESREFEIYFFRQSLCLLPFLTAEAANIEAGRRGAGVICPLHSRRRGPVSRSLLIAWLNII